jgi:hypothetical protein
MKPLKINHNGGFFSCCTILLREIVLHFNTHKELPNPIDTSSLWQWYKTKQSSGDIYSLFFNINNSINIDFSSKYDWQFHSRTRPGIDIQFSDFNSLPFSELSPFVRKYFEPSQEIKLLIKKLESKYNIDYKNLCSLLYRGNDKSREMKIPSKQAFLNAIKKIDKIKTDYKILIQSDVTQILDFFRNEYKHNHIIFKDEIKHIPYNPKISHLFIGSNAEESLRYIKYFLAIIYIISKSKHVICASGNISLWISLFRGNSKNLIQIK